MAEMTRICAGERLSKQAEFYIREHIAEKFSLEKIVFLKSGNRSDLSRPLIFHMFSKKLRVVHLPNTE